MEEQSVIRMACKHSFHASILSAAVTSLLRKKYSFLLGRKQAVIYAFFLGYFVAISVFPSIHFYTCLQHFSHPANIVLLISV